MAGATVAGFDVGNCTSCVALARKRGIDVIMNRESKRETPAMVSFGDKMRFIGTDGAAKQVANVKNTVVQMKRLIGKRFQDPDVQDDIKRFPFKVTEGPNGGISIDVMFAGEMASFTPEQILAMVLKDLKKIADEEGAPITDCVLTVPVYFTEAERYAMLNAASVAGLNCLRLMNETTATALAYGIYKTDLPADEPTFVAFVDFGHSSLQVCVVELRKGQLEVKSHAWDRRTGGRDFDEALYEHFCDEFKQKYRLDVRSNAKAGFKLRASCDKVKRMLSANPEAPLNIECLMEDTDVRSMMTREKLEELSEPLLARILGPCQQALEASGVSKEALANVELVGAASRIPAVARIIREFFGREPSRTLNTKCAMLSPLFRVREFDVKDSNPYAVELRWESDGEAKSQRIFGKGNAVPSLKAITLKKVAPFSLQLHYADDSGVPEAMSKHLGTYEVADFEVPHGEDKATLKVQVRMNLHGLAAVDSVHSLMEEEYEETVQPAPASEAEAGPAGAATPMDTDANGAAEGSNEATPAAAADAAADAQADSTAAASMETDAPAAADAAPAAAPPQVVKKKRTRKTDVPVAVTHRGGLSNADINQLLEVEGQMSAADRLQEETNEAKNALETYVYMLRGRLSDQLVEFVKEDTRTQLMAELDTMEDWLYEEGEDVMKSVYVEKLAALRGRGEPIELRYSEAQTRQQAVAELAAAAERYSGQASAPDAKLAHLTPEELAKVMEECRTASSWLQDRQQMQSQLQKHEEPALLTADIKKKLETLCRACDAVLTKPPPSKKREPKEDAAAVGGEGGQPMDTDAAAAAEDKPTDADAPMET